MRLLNRNPAGYPMPDFMIGQIPASGQSDNGKLPVPAYQGQWLTGTVPVNFILAVVIGIKR
jgi:hypothetical protein